MIPIKDKYKKKTCNLPKKNWKKKDVDFEDRACHYWNASNSFEQPSDVKRLSIIWPK